MLAPFRFSFLFFFLLLFARGANGQEVENITVFGVQYRPILAAPLLDTGPISTSDEEFTATVTPQFGYDIGMAIRWRIEGRWAIETGIDQIRRNFEVRVEDQQGPYENSMEFGMVAYQLPLRALVYVRLGEQLYMNAAAGGVADFFPSDWTSSDGDISQYTQRWDWVVGGFTANLGFELRTENTGFFYLGGTYHRPLSQAPDFRPDIAAMRVNYRRNGMRTHEQILRVPGNYITLDLKYFFPFKGER